MRYVESVIFIHVAASAIALEASWWRDVTSGADFLKRRDLLLIIYATLISLENLYSPL